MYDAMKIQIADDTVLNSINVLHLQVGLIQKNNLIMIIVFISVNNMYFSVAKNGQTWTKHRPQPPQ